MRFNILQLLKNLRFHSHGKEMTDAVILSWANEMVKHSGKSSRVESFRDKSLSTDIFFLELLAAPEPRVVDWQLVTKGETDEDKKMNASYIISVTRKLWLFNVVVVAGGHCGGKKPTIVHDGVDIRSSAQ